MGCLTELIFDFIGEFLISLVGDKRISKWVRYPLIFIFGALYLTIVTGSFILAFSVIQDNLLGGLIVLVIAIAFVALGIRAYVRNFHR